MPLASRRLGEALLHIYEFPFGSAIYLPDLLRFDADTPGLVEDFSLHQTCLQQGFKNWLNVAVVSDTYDDVLQKTESCLIAAFNEDCREGGWLWKMMNYRNSDPQ